MRVSAAIKSLIHGVTTNARILASKLFLREQTNVQTVSGSGLHKRPPAELVSLALDSDYVNDADNVSYTQSFKIRNISYFLQVQIDLLTDTVTLLCYDKLGTIYPVNITSGDTDYLLDTVTKRDLSVVVQGDTVFLTNKTKVVTMETELRESNNVSLIHVKQAPEALTDLKVTFVDDADATHTATYTTLSGLDTRGTNIIAFHIATAINALTTSGVTAYYAGSTVAVVRDSNDYAQVTTQDEANNNVLTAINGTLDTVLDLPRWAIPTPVLTIKPNAESDKGIFYVLGIEDAEVSSPAALTPDIVMTAGWLDWNGIKVSGWSIRNIDFVNPPTVGSIVPTSYAINSVDVEHIASSNLFSVPYFYIAPAWNGDFGSGQISKRIIRETRSGNLLYSGTPEYHSGGYRFPVPTLHYFTDGMSYDIFINQVDPTASTLTQMNWEETSAAGEQYKLNATTMPHTLSPTTTVLGALEFNLDELVWDEKSAGDLITNPEPLFITNTIQDTALFQNRLIFLVGDEVATTETDNTRSVFKNTVVQSLSTHPVRIRSTSPKAGTLNKALNHNRDLLLFSDEIQFKFSGAIPLTPQTAGMPVTSAYKNLNSVDPESIGSEVYFAFDYGKNFTGIAKYKTADSAATDLDTAEPITEHVKTYIEGTPHKILGDANLGVIYMVQQSGKIYVCDYDPEITRVENPRYAWSLWKDLSGTTALSIEDVILDQTDLILVVEHAGQLDLLKLDTVEDPTAAVKQTYVDYQVSDVVSGTGTITLSSDYPLTEDIRVIHDSTSAEAGNLMPYVQTANVLQIDVAYAGTDIIYGIPFKSSITPNTIYIRDEGGNVNSQTNLRISRFLVELENSADVSASIVSDYYNYDDQLWTGLIVGDIRTVTDQVADNTGQFNIAFKQRNDLADLQIYSEGHLPMNITKIDWVGTYNSRGRRF